MMLRRRLILLALPALCVDALLAQTTGSIAGWLSDTGGAPIPGATVEVFGANLQGHRTAVTAKDGTCRLGAIPPGRYTVRGSLAGFASLEKTVTVSVDATAIVKMILQLQVDEHVFVSSEGSFVDTTSTTAARSYGNNVIFHLPVDRNYADVVMTSSGAVTDLGSSQGRSIGIAVNGSSSAESQWTVDGTNTTNVMRGVQGKALNPESIQEVEVKTGGFGAEYGRSVGGVINVVTKSGGNTFHGDAFFYYDDSNMHADRLFVEGKDSPNSGMHVAEYQRSDYGADLGGFLLRDRLWFFGAYNRTTFPAQVSRLVSNDYVPSSMRFPLDGTDQLYSAKLTWNPASGSTIVGTVFSDPTTNSGAGAADPRRESSVFRTITSPDPGTWESQRSVGAVDFGLQVGQVFGSSGFLNVLAARHQDRFELDPIAAGEAVRISDHTCEGGSPFIPCVPPTEENFSSGGFGNLGGPGDNSESYRDQFRADASFYRGSHAVKFGADYQNAWTTALAHYSGGQIVSRYNNQGTVYYGHHFNTDTAGDLTLVPGTYRGGATEVGAFAQDSWTVLPGLTINAGLRWDQERMQDYRDVTVMTMTNEWQPRLGIAWDPWGDGATRVYAFAGRFYYSMPTEVAVRVFGGVTSRTTWNYDPLDVTPADVPGRFNAPPVTNPASLVDDGLVGVSLDEFTIGADRAISPTLSIGLKGTYRSLNNAIEDRVDLDPLAPENQGTASAMINAGGSGKFARGDFYSCNGLAAPYNNCDPDTPLYGAPAAGPARRIFRALELAVRDTVSDRLWLQATYVYASLRGNYDGEVSEGFGGQTTPGINADYDYPLLERNAYGRLYLDRPLDLRLSGFYTTPVGLSVGLQTYVISGPPLNRLGDLNDSYPLYIDPRGSTGRMPTQWDANLTLEYPFRVGPATVTLQGYVFNLFDNQIAIKQDQWWTTVLSPHYPDDMFDPNQPQRNLDYGLITKRQAPRFFRAAVRVSF